MMKRYAIYYAPDPGGFADAAAGWLGWDAVAGRVVGQPVLPVPLADWTAEPRRYGFHGTLKPPFRLADGVALDDLLETLAVLAQALPVVEMDGLDLVTLDRFLALVPRGDATALGDLAADVVDRLDRFRAPLSEAELARRRPESLTARQRDLLSRYGYPYVMDEFRFHLTLSGPLKAADLAMLHPLAMAHFAPHLPQPFRVTALSLFGEDEAGFHLLHRYALTG